MNAVRFRRFVAISLAASAVLCTFSISPAAAQRKAFRVSSLSIADPQIFLQEIGGCANALNPILNSVLNTQYLQLCEPVTEGQPDPCTFGFNLLAVFDPLVQTASGSSPVPCTSGGQPCDLDFALVDECTRTGGASGTTTCSTMTEFIAPTTYSNALPGVTCLAPHAGTFGANNTGSPAVAAVTGSGANNCAVSGTLDLIFELGDGLITIPLKGAQLAARYNGNPATSLTSGLARGFLSEADANAIMIDIDITSPVVLSINEPLSYLLAGGETNCKTTNDDRDTNPPGELNGERGWWFYLTFAATSVTVGEFPTPTATSTVGLATPTPTATPPSTSTPVFTNTPIPTNTPPTPPTSTPTDTPPAPTPTVTPIPPTNTPVQAACPGDCDGNGVVPINEVQRVANIYLETQPLSQCTRADRNNDGMVAINEVVLASNSYQFDCPAP